MSRAFRTLLAGLIAALTVLPLGGYAQNAAQPAPFSKEQIEQLVAPIALYPDALVAQILMASTYPLEVVSAARWVKENPKVKDKALEDAMQKQPWDPSVKSLAAVPQVLAMMNDKLDMTQKLGDAFLGQQKEVLDAVQRLRAKAQAAGNLKSGKEQKVTTAQEGGTTIIKIEPASPQVVYVPIYNPTVVYGPWPYAAYPPYYYYPPGYVAGTAIFSFAVGVAVGNAMWGNANWGRGDVNVNISHYNSFNRTNINNTNWQHNVEHRKGVQYRDAGSQKKYGGAQRPGADSREAFRGRAEQGREQLARDQAGTKDRAGGAGDRQRDAAGQRGRAGGLQQAGGRQAAAFDGIGGGAETRSFSDRGASSRASAASQGRAGGGAARSGGGGGGGARGGGRDGRK